VPGLAPSVAQDRIDAGEPHVIRFLGNHQIYDFGKITHYPAAHRMMASQCFS
jgi:hypothetical protein